MIFGISENMRMHDITNSTVRMFADASITKSIAGIFGAVVAYVFPTAAIQDAAIGAAVLLVIDSITGIWASVVNDRPLESRRFARILSKLIGYSASAIAVSIAFRLLPPLTEFRESAVTAIFWIVIATESISILENVDAMGVRLPKWLSAMLRGELSDLRKKRE